MRKTKIVCTMGPAVDSDEAVRRLIQNGLNVARFNFSHGDYEEHLGRVERVRRIAKEENKNVALLLDTKGPEIRTGKFKDKKVMLNEGEEVIIRHEDILGDSHEFSCTYKQLHHDVKPDDRIMIDDGLVELKVTRIEGEDVYTVVDNAGEVSNYKSINLPNVKTQLPSMTERDENDILFAVEHGMDFIAASFIRKAEDVEAIKKLLNDHGAGQIQVISKIENQEGVDNFEEILSVSDGIMVARGDLGVEVPVEKVPGIQKYILSRCLEEGKYSITATQMLDSMIRNPRPTRAEVSDVANALLDGTGAIMLSGETANGKYSAEAVAMMNTIAREIEENIDTDLYSIENVEEAVSNVVTATGEAAVAVSNAIHAAAILCVTDSGRTPRSISRFRPEAPIVALTYDARSQRQMSLTWGVEAFYDESLKSSDNEAFFDAAITLAKENGIIDAGDLVVLVCGSPVGQAGSTNTMIVRHVDSKVLNGKSMGTRIEMGEVFILDDEREDFVFLPDNPVLVAENFTEDDLPLIREAVALVTEAADVKDNKAIEVARNLNLPIIYGVKDATKLLENDQVVSVDPVKKIVK